MTTSAALLGQHDLANHWQQILTRIDEVPEGVTVAVSLRHVESGTQRDHLGHRSFVAASTIKILILIAVGRAIDAGTLSPSTRIIPEPHTRVGGSGVLNWLSEDLEPTVTDQVWLMIAVSDNTASNVLIDTVGLSAIHEVQRDLGLHETMLYRHFMSQKRRPQDPSNSVSAADLTVMLTAIATDRAASAER